MVKESFETLFPEKVSQYEFILKYSAAFSGYNANARMRGNTIILRMSKEWRGVSREIQMGLIQELLIRLFKKKMHTMNMDLYHMFLKRIHIAIPKDQSDDILRSAFEHLNEAYFNQTMEIPNLKWGQDSTRRLGTYEFGTDTITISRILHPNNCPDKELMHYVLYHEILHKKFKFNSHAGHTRAHTREFREWERNYPNAPLLEKRLSLLASKRRFTKSLKPSTLFGIPWP